jgi:hypothetical protein
MRSVIAVLAGIVAVGIFAGAYAKEGAAGKTPVFVELFTSEGCSSCPPADRILEELDRRQPVAGADVVVLSEHVDYWNRLGWRDPYSSRAFSDRQKKYAETLRGGDVYTPQMVVDGRTGFVGSDEGEALKAIGAAARGAKTAVALTARREGDRELVRVEAPSGAGELFVVLAHDRVRSQVSAGENSGRALSHVAVAYSVNRVHAGREVSMPAQAGATRVVAFLRDRSGAVLGVAQIKN